jgi:hypothetical protein
LLAYCTKGARAKKAGEGDSSENTLVLFISGGDEMENINKITPLRRVSVCVMMNQKEGSL